MFILLNTAKLQAAETTLDIAYLLMLLSNPVVMAIVVLLLIIALILIFSVIMDF